MTAAILYRLYAIKSDIVRKIIRIIITKIENGEFYSSTLRKIFKDYHNIEIGMYSYGGCFVLGNIPEGTRIGRYGSFAPFQIFPRNHPIDFISTHPFFFNTILGYTKKELMESTELHIGHDVWIGENALIMSNVKKIGNGAVLGAGAIVTKDIPPYAIVVGNPARIIKFRFSEETIKKIQNSNWWDQDINQLKINIEKYTRPFEDSLEGLNFS